MKKILLAGAELIGGFFQFGSGHGVKLQLKRIFSSSYVRERVTVTGGAWRTVGSRRTGGESGFRRFRQQSVQVAIQRAEFFAQGIKSWLRRAGAGLFPWKLRG